MYFNRKCKITFVSHGATIYSEEGRLCDTENYPPLSELGVEESNNVVKYLRSRAVKNDVIYSSPALRTIQSALMISKFFKQEYVIVDDLTPRKVGKWNNMTYSDIIENYPDDFMNMINNPDAVPCEGAESSTDFINRIGNSINLLVKQNIGNRIIIVTHPEIIQAAICSALGIDADKLQKIYIRTGSVTQISYFEDWASLVYSDHVPI